MAPCLCDNRGYVRALEEDDFGFPDKVDTLAELSDAILGRCRHCGAWWERLPHYMYGNAWYRTNQARWHPSDAALAIGVAGAEARAGPLTG
jgi:hypothetical protein